MKMIILIPLLLVCLSFAEAKYMEGELNSGDNWVFIARFCFLSLHGKFEYDVEYPEVGTLLSIDRCYEYLYS